jgi:small subunit ribosomal protein S17
MENKRGNRRVMIGVVSSDKMNKTITVKVSNLVQHPIFKKYIKRVAFFKAHDESNEAKMGDKVEIMECRRLSKTKAWRLVKVLEKAPQK